MSRKEELTDPWDTSEFDDPFAIRETDEDRDLGFSAPPPVVAPVKPAASSSGFLGGLFGGASKPKVPTAPIAAAGSGAPSFDDSSASPSSLPSTTPASGAVGGHLSAADISRATFAPQLGLQGRLLAAQAAAVSGASGSGLPSSSSSTEGSAGQFLSVGRRGLWGQTSYNAGYSYFGGLLLGGVVGFLNGIRTSPNNKPRILLNSVLNGSGKFGAKAGNAAGVMAMVYTFTHRQLEDMEFDTLPGWINRHWPGGATRIFASGRWDLAIPLGAAAITGVLFTLPRAISMRGIHKTDATALKRLSVVSVGSAATVAGVYALMHIGPMVFGERSPFRLA